VRRASDEGESGGGGGGGCAVAAVSAGEGVEGGEASRGAVCFRRGHDIVIPPLVSPVGEAAGQAAGHEPSASARPLAILYGRCSGLAAGYSFNVRQRLWRAYRNDTSILLREGASESANPEEYWRALRHEAPFCLAPPGHARWSVRFYEAVLAGCVPVTFETSSSAAAAIAMPWEGGEEGGAEGGEEEAWEGEWKGGEGEGGIRYDRFRLSVGCEAGGIEQLRGRLEALRDGPSLAAMRGALRAAATAFDWEGEEAAARRGGGGGGEAGRAAGPMARLMEELGRRADALPPAEADAGAAEAARRGDGAEGERRRRRRRRRKRRRRAGRDLRPLGPEGELEAEGGGEL